MYLLVLAHKYHLKSSLCVLYICPSMYMLTLLILRNGGKYFEWAQKFFC